jgi:Domain of unknown function (DUF5666)
MQEPTTNAESPPTWTATSPEAEPGTGATPGEGATPAGAGPSGEGAMPAPAGTSGGPNRRNLGLAALAGAIGIGALAIGIAIGGGAPSGGSATVPAAEGRRVVVSDAAWTSPDGRTQVRLDERGGRGMPGAIGRGAISITAINGSKLSLQTDNGWTRTIDATGATITKGGETVTVSALKVGDQIRFTETRNDDGTYTVTAIAVVQPSVAGTVASVSGSTVTVTGRDGGTSKVLLTSSTTYELAGKAATKDAVVAGAQIVATGTLAADGTLTATSVEVAPATAAGTVKEKSASSITLTTRDGSTVVVKVDSGTTYQVGGVTSPTLADVAVGAVVMASGTKNADGSLTATVVRSWAAGQDGGPGMGDWGRGGHGGRGGPGWDWPDAPDASPSATPSGSGTNG